jgi:hypothetical protein
VGSSSGSNTYKVDAISSGLPNAVADSTCILLDPMEITFLMCEIGIRLPADPS